MYIYFKNACLTQPQRSAHEPERTCKLLQWRIDKDSEGGRVCREIAQDLSSLSKKTVLDVVTTHHRLRELDI